MKKMHKLGEKVFAGYYGIGVYHPKTKVNIGTLWREAMLFGADFIFTIGHRYNKQASDTTKTIRNIPLWEFKTFEEFRKHMPKHAKLVIIEMDKKAVSLKDYKHPKQAIYLLGAEDYGIPTKLLNKYDDIVQIPQVYNFSSSNVAVSGSIVLYDRLIKTKI